MSSTATTTTSPTNLQIDKITSFLPASNRALLTSPSRPGTKPPIANREALAGAELEPPTKRIRLGPISQTSLFTQCLEKQVFPHIDEPLSELPKDKVNTLEIGKRVIAILTGPEFSDEFRRGNGTLSAEFEAELAFRAVAEIHALAVRPEYHFPIVPSSTIPSRPQPQQRVETPVPIPQIPHGARADIKRLSSAPSLIPRYSSSPIPLPAIPYQHQAASKPLASTNGTAPKRERSPSVPQVVKPSKPPEIIIIDSSDDDENVPEPPKRPKPLDRTDKPPAQPRTDLLPTPPPKPINTSSVPAAPAAIPSRVKKTRGPERTPRDYRRLAYPSVWRDRELVERASERRPLPKWLSEARQPYVTAETRESVLGAGQQLLQLDDLRLGQLGTFHVDFSLDETKYLSILARQTLLLSTEPKNDPKRDLSRVLKANPRHISRILDAVGRGNRLPRRTRADVENFFRDLVDRKTSSEAVRLTVESDESGRRGDFFRSSRVNSLLFAREVAGQRGFGSMRRLEHFNNEFRKCREDGFGVRGDWTGCAGDIMTAVWVSNDAFICGTTEHSDSHNQQYNKPGNLVLGSCILGTLRAYPEHRIVRPIVEKGENSTDAMIQSQDPWLYSSVVSSDYDATHGRAFTSAFDRSVKIWKVEPSGASMNLLGEWKHDGNVDFVAASKHKSGIVATAAGVATDAVRIYNVDETHISKSPFRSYSCSRVTDDKGNAVSTEKWAYFPATMQWGLAESVKHLLLVGYSPRSRTGDDNDIPEDRRDSGELCLWDGLTGERWRVTSATTQNVFEVLWHPNQPSFIAATSPLGNDLEPSVRTQIRIFRPDNSTEFGAKAFTPVKTLDCTAIDINELTFMPNSYSYCYVTAGCTDGCTYVWDTSRQTDKPIHVLRHGEPIDEYRGVREREDVGVKFTAWGTSLDRFYTGSSDGLVKVWNVRSENKPHVRTILSATAPITAGMFSPDKTKLVIGDASGGVFMLSVDERDQIPPYFVEVNYPSGKVKLRRPTPMIPHPEPPPPTHDAAGQLIITEPGEVIARRYLDSLQLKLDHRRHIGAVQGPRYAETGLFRREAHFNGDPAQPLLASWEVQQQEAQRGFLGGRRDRSLPLRLVRELGSLEALHSRNISLDLDVERLPEETRRRLEREGVDFELMTSYTLEGSRLIEF